MRTTVRPPARSPNRRAVRSAASHGEGPHGATATPTVKLQKRLAEAGLGSRRAMEELIQAGKVSVNGRTARLGARVGPADRIAVAGEPLPDVRARRAAREPRVVLYHKPEGEIVSRRDPEGRPSVFDRVPIVQRGRWLAVGRLDFNTCGLLVFTDSGELANRLTHPRFQQPRDYAARVVGELSGDQLQRLRNGIELEDGPARFELLEPQGGEGTNRWYRVRVREGRNRLVRRLFAAVGVTVSRLMRTRFGPFELPPRVKRGQWLRLEAEEVKEILRRLEAPGERAPRGREPRSDGQGPQRPPRRQNTRPAGYELERAPRRRDTRPGGHDLDRTPRGRDTRPGGHDLERTSRRRDTRPVGHELERAPRGQDMRPAGHGPKRASRGQRGGELKPRVAGAAREPRREEAPSGAAAAPHRRPHRYRAR